MYESGAEHFVFMSNRASWVCAGRAQQYPINHNMTFVYKQEKCYSFSKTVNETTSRQCLEEKV